MRYTEHEVQRLQEMSNQLLRLIEHGTPAQFKTVIERVRCSPDDKLIMVGWEPFDLPAGYVQLWFDSGFTCGIDSEGRSSS